jgi:glyoxylase-like metal-dependent hydrolase (beta-lactamase superfamily II)
MNALMARLQGIVFRLAVLAGIGMLGSAALAQQPADSLTVTRLKDNVYYAAGGGGNSGIIIGQAGVIVVDAKINEQSAKQLLAEIAKLTPKPVTDVIETHSDGDHVNGVQWFPAGVTIIAHESNKREQEAALKAGTNTPPADRLPTRVVRGDSPKGVRESLTLQGVKFQLLHWVPAHTSGDLVVFLPDQGIVFTGDIIVTNRPDPIIHLEKNGSSAGWVTTAEGIAKLNAQQFVPGHGNVLSKADLQAKVQQTSKKREQIAAMVKQGKTLEEIKAAFPGPAAGGRFPGLPEIVSQEMTKK